MCRTTDHPIRRLPNAQNAHRHRLGSRHRRAGGPCGPANAQGQARQEGRRDDADGRQSDQNAAQTCKAERTKLGEDAFKAKYGTNANKANAFGKCVSGASTSKKEGDDEDENGATESKAEQNAAKKCKAERKQLGEDAFRAKYGTNPNKANAFGKCVSKLAKAKSSS